MISFAGSYFGVLLLKQALRHYGLLDLPNERSSHTAPVPRGGGIVIAIAMLAVVTAGATRDRTLWPVLVAMTSIAAVSLVDDVRGLPSGLRLAVQIAAAAGAALSAGTWSRVAVGPYVMDLPASLSTVVTIFWITGLTNAYNFMDGIDLMATGQAVAAGCGWMAIGLVTRTPEFALMGVVIAATSAGFAIHNWPPASIFMGDVCSASLGFTFATMSVWSLRHDPKLAICGALLVWPFLFDTAFTLVRRLRRGEQLMTAHRSHLYQRLVISGMSHIRVSALYFGADALGLMCALAIASNVPRSGALSAIVIVSASTSLWLLVYYSEKKAHLTVG